MRVGQVVNWHNLDSIEHTATLSGAFDTGRIAAFSAHDNAVTMSRAGTYTYHCTIHTGMVGTIIVQ
jgi:plastocyanin